jgi:hypothetical protein
MLEQAITNLVDGKSDFEEISIRLEFEIPDDLAQEFNKELKQIEPHLR